MKNYKRRRQYVKLILILIAIIIGFSASVIATGRNVEGTFYEDKDRDENLSIESSSSYENVTSPLLINEFAFGSNLSQEIILKYLSNGTILNSSAQIQLPYTWEGYHLEAYIYEISENRSWVYNPGFQNSLSPWTNGTSDVGSHTNNPQSSWVDDGHGTDDDCVSFSMVGEYYDITGHYYYDAGDSAWVEQTFTVPRGQVLWAGITFEYSAETQSSWGMTGFFNIFVEVEGVSVRRIPFDTIYSEGDWYSTGMIEIDKSIFNLPLDNNITLKIGLESTQDVGYSPDIKPEASIDNVVLYLITLSKPSDLNLKMNGLNVSDESGSYGSYGYGRASQYFTPYETDSPILANFTWSPSPDPSTINGLGIEVKMYVDLYLNITKTSKTFFDTDLADEGVIYYRDNSSYTTWQFYVYVRRPPGFNSYYANCSIMKDWNITFVGPPLSPTENVVSNLVGGNPGDGYFKLVYSKFGDKASDGFWLFKASSPNYVAEIWTQVYDSGTWRNEIVFRPSNITRFRVKVSPPPSHSLPSNVTLTKVKLNVYNPDGTLWFSREEYLDSQSYATFEQFYLAGSNTTGGLYVYEVLWSNRTEAGYMERTFSIIHKTSLTPQFDSYSVYIGDIPSVRVRFMDDDSGRIITGAEVLGNWSGEIVKFYYINGWYQGDLNTSKLPDAGTYKVRINATKDYYDSSYVFVTITVSYLTELVSENYSITTIWGNEAKIDVLYRRKPDGVGISGANVYTNWTDSWTYTDHGNGSYTIILSTTSTMINTYVVSVFLSKDGYTSSNLIFIVRVERHASELTVAQGLVLNAIWGEHASINATFKDKVTGELIYHANLTYNWPLGSHFITDNGTGSYYIDLDTKGLLPGKYYLSLIATKPGYQTGLVTLTIFVNPIPQSGYFSELSIKAPNGTVVLSKSNETEIDVPIGDTLTVYLNLTDYYGESVEDSTVVYSWIYGIGRMEEVSPGIYSLELNTSLIPLDEYQITIKAEDQYHEEITLSLKLGVTLIPAEIILPYPAISINEFRPINVTFFYIDTWHGVGIEGATIEVEILRDGEVIETLEVKDLGNGKYEGAFRVGLAEGVYTIRIRASADNYGVSELSIPLTVTPAETIFTTLGPYSVALGAISLVAAVGYISYTQYFGIPPIVRKMRSLESSIKKGKVPKGPIDVKTREDIISQDLQDSFSIISDIVPVEVLKENMISPIEIKEVVVTDELIMDELSKIPGLTEEERAQLFESMKKMPPKDRIVLIEELKRQMEERKGEE
ncbi:MAG: MSCRAMM family protein [Candidatus Asgardarchaeia archaeon]